MRPSVLLGCIALGMVVGASSVVRAAATSTALAESAATGPCADFVKAVCAKSGDNSRFCTDLKSVSGILPPAACKTASGQLSYVLDKIESIRKTCDKLVSDLCRDVGPNTETCKMVQTQTRAFPPERCTSMMERYSDVLAELKKMEATNKPLTTAQQKQIIGSGAPSIGPANAKVTVVEFADFQCPFSARAAKVVKDIKEKYGTKVRFVFRQFPLTFHANAHQAAEAALAAHAQGKFWDYHDKLFAWGPTSSSGVQNPDLTREALEKYATQVGLNMARFTKALDGKEYATKVDAEIKLAGDVAVQGTPTMFVNGKRILNVTDYDTVAKSIDDALASGAR
jgi:protein-disulfide isomerase